MMPSLASCSLSEMLSALSPQQPLVYQLYLNPDRTLSESMIERVVERGGKVLVVTVDAPTLGRRMRSRKNIFHLFLL